MRRADWKWDREFEKEEDGRVCLDQWLWRGTMLGAENTRGVRGEEGVCGGAVGEFRSQ